MVNVQYINSFPFNGEKDAIDVRFATVKEVPNIEREHLAFSSNRASLREMGQR